MSAHRRRMRHTNVARVQLVFLPLLVLILLVIILAESLAAAARAFGTVWKDENGSLRRWAYRDVYRVARYGSVWDELDDRGRPKAWSR